MGKRASRFWGVRMVLTLLLALTAAAALQLLQPAQPAGASHYRAMQLSWAKKTATTATFTATIAMRANYFGPPPAAGSTINTGNTIAFGDGASSDDAFYVQVVDASANNNYMILQKVVDHAYTGNGPFTAQISACCRLNAPQHINNPGASIMISTLVNFATNGSGGVSSSLPPIVDCPRSAVCSFVIPAIDPDGQQLRYRLATGAEMTGSNGVQPGPPQAPHAATINPVTGAYSWDTTGAQEASSGFSYYSTQVIVEKLDSSANVVSQVGVDFFLRLSDVTSADTAPEWHPVTPADGATFNVVTGGTVTFSTEAHDHDAGDNVTLGILNKPASATYTTSSPSAGLADGTFTWTPNTPGSYIVTFTATDKQGLGATQRSITINVGTGTTLTVASASGPTGGTATVSATLTDTNSSGPIAGKGVAFTVGGNSCAATTDANGVATCSISLAGVTNGATLTGMFNGGGGLNSATGTNTVAVTAGRATLTLSGLSQTYDGTPKPATVTVSPSSAGPVVVTYDGSTTAPTEPGSYAVVAHLNDPNYTAPDATGTLVIAKAAATIALADLGPFTYDGAAHPGTATTTPAGLAGLTFTYNGAAAAPVNAGSYAVVAHLDNPRYAAPDATGTITINPAAATLALGNLTQTYTGSPLAATASTSPAGLGPLAFTYDGGATAPTNAGSYAVVAHLNDPNYTAPDATGTLVIAKADQTLTFAALADRTYGDAPFALGATVNSPLAVVYAATGTCTVSGGTLTLTGAGTCTVTASQPGDANHNAAAALARTFAIAKNTPTITWNPASPIAYGTPLGDAQLNALVSNIPGTTTPVPGARSYNPSKGAVLNTGTQTLTVSFVPFDTANFTGSSATATITVTGGTEAITFAALPDKAYGDAPFGIGATASTGLPVTFAATGQCTVAPNGTGTALVTLTGAGSCAVTASQPGDANHPALAPVTRTFAIAKATPTITWPTPAPITQGTALSGTQLDATANVPGSFTYTPAAGTILATGTQTLSVTFTPDDAANYASVSASTSIGVGLAAQTLTFAALPDRTYGDAPFALVASASSNLPIVFTTTGPCTVSGTTLTLTGAGPCTVTATQAGGGSFAPASLAHTFAIAKATPVIAWATPAPIAVGTPLGAAQLDATAPIPGAFIYDPAVGTVLPAGAQPLRVIFLPFDSSNYLGTTASVTLAVNKLPQAVTFPPIAGAPSLGNPLPLQATSDSGLPITYTASGPCRIEGSTAIPTGNGTCTVTATQAGDATHAPASSARSFQIGATAAGYLLTMTTDGGGTVGVNPLPNVQAIRYSAGTLVTLAPQGPAGSILVGWRVDGTFQGWAAPLTLTMDTDHTVQGIYRNRPSFSDVNAGTFGAEAIAQLAARGIVKGYGDGSFGPTDFVVRAQIAAMVARATGSGAPDGPGIGPSTWATEDHGNHFADRNGVDSELWRTIGSLEYHNVARGYDAATYDPTGTVSHAQAISLITRAMVAKGYWAQQPDDASLYPAIPASSGHRTDVATFVHYAGALPQAAPTDRYDGPSGWDAPASRAWVAQTLWSALDVYHIVDRVP